MARQPDIQTNPFSGDLTMTIVFNTKTITLRALIAATAMSAAVAAGPAHADDVAAIADAMGDAFSSQADTIREAAASISWAEFERRIAGKD
jgi:hypothetical protein